MMELLLFGKPQLPHRSGGSWVFSDVTLCQAQLHISVAYRLLSHIADKYRQASADGG